MERCTRLIAAVFVIGAGTTRHFYPEKISHSEKWDSFTKLLESENDNKEIPVVKVRQKNMILYAGKLKSRELLKMYGVCGFVEETLSGYQRELYEEKVNDIYKYLIECPKAVIQQYS